MNQRYLLATSTSVDVSGVKVPDNVDDKYFQRVKAEKTKKDGDIFDNKKEAYTAFEQRKADQVTVDNQVGFKLILRIISMMIILPPQAEQYC